MITLLLGKEETKKYYVDEFLNEQLTQVAENAYANRNLTKDSKLLMFEKLCDQIKTSFRKEGELNQQNFETSLIRQKKAILGYPSEVKYFKDRIKEYLRVNNLMGEWYPLWYQNLVDAIFHESWGLAGLAHWVENATPEYKRSSGAKIIGERIYFLIDGVMQLQPQTISKDRRQQLKKALLLNEPAKKITDPYNDVFLLDNTRITIFGNQFTKNDRDVIVFRKFLVQDFTFEKQVQLNTIPDYSVPFFKLFCKLGYNVIIAGGPNSGKTTFYETMQKYQHPNLQGIQIETDPEVDMEKVLPGSPIMELLADGDDLNSIMKPILRADPDYIMLGEARDGQALYVGVRAANKGTRRVKMTYHTTGIIDICGQIAEEIVECRGGSLNRTTVKVARSFGYVFEFFYRNNQKNIKKLKSIHEIRYDEVTHKIHILRICKYNLEKDIWEWAYHFGEDKREIGLLESAEDVARFDAMLKEFAEKYPLNEETVFTPEYF